MSWQDLHVKSCKADVTTPLNHRGYCILQKIKTKKRAAPFSPSEGCNWLSGMGGWCHRCFPVRCSCNGVNLAPRWAISVRPHPMKDTLVPPPHLASRPSPSIPPPLPFLISLRRFPPLPLIFLPVPLPLHIVHLHLSPRVTPHQLFPYPAPPPPRPAKNMKTIRHLHGGRGGDISVIIICWNENGTFDLMLHTGTVARNTAPTCTHTHTPVGWQCILEKHKYLFHWAVRCLWRSCVGVCCI